MNTRLEAFTRAAALRSGFYEAMLLNLGSLLEGLRRLDEAATWPRKGRGPSSQRCGCGWARWAGCWAHEPPARRGDRAARRVVALQPNLVDARDQLLHALAEMGQMDEAIEHYGIRQCWPAAEWIGDL